MQFTIVGHIPKRTTLWAEIGNKLGELWKICVDLMDDLEKRVQAVIPPFVRAMRALTEAVFNVLRLNVGVSIARLFLGGKVVS